MGAPEFFAACVLAPLQALLLSLSLAASFNSADAYLGSSEEMAANRCLGDASAALGFQAAEKMLLQLAARGAEGEGEAPPAGLLLPLWQSALNLLATCESGVCGLFCSPRPGQGWAVGQRILTGSLSWMSQQSALQVFCSCNTSEASPCLLSNSLRLPGPAKRWEIDAAGIPNAAS